MAVVACPVFLAGCATTEDTTARAELRAASSSALVVDDCDHAMAYDGATKSMWRYCPDGYGSTVPFAVPDSVAVSRPTDVAAGRIKSDPYLTSTPDDYFPDDYDIPTIDNPTNATEQATYDAAIDNCSRFGWFGNAEGTPPYSSYDAGLPLVKQEDIKSGHVCFGFGNTIDNWYQIDLTAAHNHRYDCKRLWMFDKRYWDTDVRKSQTLLADPGFQPWDPFTSAPRPGDRLATVLPPRPSPVVPGQYHGYSFCRNKFFVWCTLQGRKAKVMTSTAVWTATADPASAGPLPPWTNTRDVILATEAGRPFVTSSEMCQYYDFTHKMPRRSDPAKVGWSTRKGQKACWVGP